MSRWLSLIFVLAAASAQASPSSAEDDVGRFMAEKRLVDRLEEARQVMGERVTERASQVAHRASELVVTAMGFLGVPYRRGGNSVDGGGFDCSGFVKAIYEQTVGLVLPRRANEQAAATLAIERRELQPGDLVFFNTLRRTFSHVGIYIGDNKFIHAPKPGAQVRVEDMDVSYWASRFDGARRVVTRQEPAAPRTP
ncbi:C40 family peptidase [Ramlibacter sp. PS3R-8]|uniref:C40 family peptidase n=1 Tax=Ramlibacter sp. PS3R-8 TaxID=3133437 RepID=UPI0030A141F1